ncbi:MAG: hypothetical protein IJE71_08375 [Clostridia bacterium]|nr:hypothetical protein [Clostridia bacterium]
MGTLADSLFTVLMSWVRALVSGIWALFSAEHTTALEFLGKNWLLIVAVLVAAGLVIDWIIWLLRWQPYHLWAQRARRILRIEEPEEEEETHTRAHAAVTRSMEDVSPRADEPQEDDGMAPLYISEAFDEEQAREAIAYADSVPDEELRAYPGMRYGAQAALQEDLSGTTKYTAMRAEGPGAAEVARRRAEIDAWQQQMQEEARAQAEQARLAKEAYEAEQARLAKEAYEAEQARLAKEAYEAEQARLAQEAYERELAEYERKKAQYELELAEYERQKAAYEAQLAAQAEQEAAAQQAQAAAAPGASRRRRAAVQTYSDYIEGDTVSELPAPPDWPQMQQAVRRTQEKPAEKQDGKKKKSGALISRVAKMIEPEEEELITRKSLPPRVDPHEAYRPAKTPRSGRKA